MKFTFKFPGGVEFHYEREPMSQERFEAICILIGIALIGSGIVTLLLSATK